ncbi:Dph6-related ATP pyrophosphatase [Rossellomorea aquimaris]|uniref:Dph6-related ATP pyrophosphatase n=1 Tax=Rossellomorea aquimaris TaxID=189382 RepID=UPI0007D0628D|nr:diphthine--ammonia ligase [Rossellomorea aquimaris]
MKICLSWSGGRDSMMMLHELKRMNENVQGLLTTFQEESKKIMMHEVPFSLVEKQASSLGLPLYPVWFDDSGVDNQEYEKRMMRAVTQLEEEQISHMAFGDLFLKDIREYREKQMDKTNLGSLFPLWGKNTRQLSKEFIEEGYKGVIVCVDEDQLDVSFLGREYNEEFLRDLPDTVDPCGENGEFHSFVFDGPLFDKPVSFKLKGTYQKWNRFSYVEFLT